MSPLHLNILLHYHTSPEPWECLTDTHNEYTEQLVIWDLLSRRAEKSRYGSEFETTLRGKFFIEYILSLPMPEATFRMPERESTSPLP